MVQSLEEFLEIENSFRCTERVTRVSLMRTIYY